MASAPLPRATVRIYGVNGTSGRKTLLHTIVNEAWNTGGSPDGVLASKTTNTWNTMPLNQVRMSGTRGDKIVATVQLSAADGCDASDCVLYLPVVSSVGGVKTLTWEDFGFTVDLPAASAANVEHPCGAGYSVPYGEFVQVGGGAAVCSMEDDA